MSTEELLKPRYKVIAGYPDSPFKVGHIEYFDLSDDIQEQEDLEEFAKYPHLFKKLSWWEEREEKDMPPYLNYNNGEAFYKVIYRKVGIKSDKLQIKTLDFPDSRWETWTEIEYNHLFPATEQQYKDYIINTKTLPQ